MTQQTSTPVTDSLLSDRRESGRPLEVVTPEGVPLNFVLALGGDRVGAFLLDSMLIFVALFAVWLLGTLAELSARPGILRGLLEITIFGVTNFYFIFFEARWRGFTPGKRKTGIRVIDALGGPLTTDAVVARNLMRLLELQLPAYWLLSGGEAFWPGAPGWTRLLAGLWLLTFMAMPLFNRERLRIGDLVAGTRVVRSPRNVLLPDMGGGRTLERAVEGRSYRFTPAHLGVYGEYELQVLEELLRVDRPGAGHREAMHAVSARIRRKIKWGEPVPRRETERFLRDFYAALRAKLEHKMLFGKRKKDKHARDR